MLLCCLLLEGHPDEQKLFSNLLTQAEQNQNISCLNYTYAKTLKLQYQGCKQTNGLKYAKLGCFIFKIDLYFSSLPTNKLAFPL